jgi:hypothetical protein
MLTPGEYEEFGRLWKILLEAKDWAAVQGEHDRLTLLQREAGKHLTCCQAAQDFDAVYYDGRRWYLGMSNEATKNWYFFKAREQNYRLPPPVCCPFCGTSLPAMMERFDPGVPVANLDDEYCRHCDGKYECICLPPGADWRPTKP